MAIFLKDNFLGRVWAALISDFEMVVVEFLNQPFNGFAPFAEIFKKKKLPLIMNFAIAQSACDRDEQYDTIVPLILEAAREFWLGPREGFGFELDPKVTPLMDYRRRLAGFYLTYAMYFKQPDEGRSKILISHELYDKYEAFFQTTEDDANTGNVEEDKLFLKSMLQLLKMNDAFEASLTGISSLGIEPWKRYLSQVQSNPLAEVAFEERGIQDELIPVAGGEGTARVLSEYLETKVSIASQLFESATTSQVLGLEANDSSEKDIVDILQEPMSMLAKMVVKPTLTMDLLTAEEVAERNVMNDHRDQVENLRKQMDDVEEDEGGKDNDNNEAPKVKKTKKKYMEQNSSWGKAKKSQGEEEASCSSEKLKRPHGVLSRNVGIYLEGLPFSHGSSPPEGSTSGSNANKKVGGSYVDRPGGSTSSAFGNKRK